MAYVPNPDDATQPTDAILAETAQAEFRALKGKVNAIVAGSGVRVPDRQCILDAHTDGNGIASFLSGALLTVTLLASASPFVLSFAAGFNNGGPVDTVISIGADAAAYWSALAISNNTYLSIDSITTQITTSGTFSPGSPIVTGIPSTAGMSPGMALTSIVLNFIPPVTVTIVSVDSSTQITMSTNPSVISPGGYAFIAGSSNPNTATKTLAPPQYGNSYSQAKQSVLQFAGAAGSTVFLDDFGNTWAAIGSAKVQTNSFKFGTGGLGGAGTSNALNGTTDGVRSTAFTPFLSDTGWSIRGWVNPSSLPGVGVQSTIAMFSNSGSFGAFLSIFNNGGTIRFTYNLSSNGTSNDIATNVQGTTLPVVGTWYFVELTYDIASNNYRLYINGTPEGNTTNVSNICAINTANYGMTTGNTGWFNGYLDKMEFLPYCQHSGGNVYVAPTGTPSVGAAGYASDWFDTVNMKMFQVTGPSVAANSNPVMAAVNRVYVGQAVTNTTAVVSTVSYAIRGEYREGLQIGLPATATVVAVNDNIGTHLKDIVIDAICFQNDIGYVPGDVIEPYTQGNASFQNPFSSWRQRNSCGFTTGSTTSFCAVNKTNGVASGLTLANWAYRIRAKRAF